MRADDQEAFPRTGRQRALHRLDDADLDAAVEGAIASKFRNAGQTCVCSNRFLVHDDIHDAFAERLAAAVAKFKVGNGMDEEVTVGPLIDESAVTKVESLVSAALAEGARVMCGGSRDDRPGS